MNNCARHSPSPAQHGHAGVSAAADRAAAAIVDRLARSIGHKAAVAWVHAGAVLAWSGAHRLLGDIGPASTAPGMRGSLKRLADAHPALTEFASPATVALWNHGIADQDAAAIRDLWAQHSLDDPKFRPHGYLLGNAYQALSEESRKHRALAQTPRYVTSLLLALAFGPAADGHGSMRGFRMIDPSCGTGHILIESLLTAATWIRPGRGGQHVDSPARIEAALRVVHGVDLDPYAALIARLRLVVMATAMCRSHRIALPAEWPVNVAAADALLDREHPLLVRGRYHVVLANPPYITPKAAADRDAVRAAYPEVCRGRYALSLPFHQLSTELLVPGGWCAQLTASSFMKREFGKPFVEGYLPRFDLRWVIDTSGAYIPGHGTPTVILVHRNQTPVSDKVSVVRGSRGEPSGPVDPSRGLVWRAIEETVHRKLAHQRLASAAQSTPGQLPNAADASAAPVPGRSLQPPLFDLLGGTA